MSSKVEESTRRFSGGERLRLSGLFGTVVALHLLGWGMLIWQARNYPGLLGFGTLAYSFGLRHAFDADHISAIDNTTRKLLQSGKRPLGVGLFFSLGHSSVVLLIAFAIGMAIRSVVGGIAGGHGKLTVIGGLVGTSVSGLFLVVIGVLNLVIFLDVLGVFRRMRRGEHSRTSLEERLTGGGVLTRLFGKLFTFISSSWHMFPIGFLFGLGFDTATEVGLLAMSAGAASKGISLAAIMSLPLIFAAGMSLMDTSDGVFMAKAYGWAFANPVRRLFYNLTVTGLSVFVALVIGLVELLQVIGRFTHSTTGVWALLANIDLGSVGYIIVGVFVATWAVAALVFKIRRVEDRWTRDLEG